MEKEEFARNLHGAASLMRDRVRSMSGVIVPDKMVFRILLNQSYDANANPTYERVYPEDSSPERRRALHECSEEQTVDVLWRDGAIPEWINMAVVGDTGEATLLELTCCGRYTSHIGFVYHRQYGFPPFVGTSGCTDVECVNLKEFDRLPRISERVRSLKLEGPDFDDEVVARLPEFYSLRSLAFIDTRVGHATLKKLDRYLGLNTLVLQLTPGVDFDFGWLPFLRVVEGLYVAELPDDKWHVDALWSKLPCLQFFSFEGRANLTIDLGDLSSRVPKLSGLKLSTAGDLAVTGMLPPKMNYVTFDAEGDLSVQCHLPNTAGSLRLRGRSLRGIPRLPEKIETASVYLEQASTTDFDQLFAGVLSTKRLRLRGTPLTEESVLRLVARLQPEFINLTDTGLSEKAVQRVTRKSTQPRLFDV